MTVRRLRMECGRLVPCLNGAFVPIEEHEAAMGLMQREIERLKRPEKREEI